MKAMWEIKKNCKSVQEFNKSYKMLHNELEENTTSLKKQTGKIKEYEAISHDLKQFNSVFNYCAA